MDALDLIREAEQALADTFNRFEEIAYINQDKILRAFQAHQVRDGFFCNSTGYGYGDAGRDELEGIYADVMGCEEALVRSTIVSGTHAISACLQALVRPGQAMLAVMGRPYDTLCRVIGNNTSAPGTLVERGIKYQEAPLNREGLPDLDTIAALIRPDTRLALIQRSRGYSLRPALQIDDIEILVKTIRAANPATIIFVDNCYGEFTAEREPAQVGADLMAGSLN